MIRQKFLRQLVASGIASRWASNAPSKFQKNSKILRYFENNHGYQIKPEIQLLRESVVNKLNNDESAQLDILLCTNIKHLDTESILSLLNSWGSIAPNTVHTSVFYQTFLRIVRKGSWKAAQWNQLVQIIHFIGYLNGQQDTKPFLIVLLHSVNSFPNLVKAPFYDIAVICEACFRASTGISNPGIRRKVTEILTENSYQITADSVWLVMIIKMMIFSKFFDANLLEKMAENWCKHGQLRTMPFTAQTYVMALYAHAATRSDYVFGVFIDSIGLKFQKYPSMLRFKDVAMFLWAVSSCGYNLDRAFMERDVLPYLLSQLNGRNRTEGLNLMIQCCISMWMMGYAAKPLMDQIVTVKSYSILKDKRNQRELSRFAALVDIMASERWHKLSSEQQTVEAALDRRKHSLLVPSMEKQCEKRPGLVRLRESLRHVGIADTQLEYPVKFYIAGVGGTLEGRRFHVDVMDSSTSLAQSYQPTGLLSAKIKLLKALNPNLRHALVTAEEMESMKSLDQWKEILGMSSHQC